MQRNTVLHILAVAAFAFANTASALDAGGKDGAAAVVIPAAAVAGVATADASTVPRAPRGDGSQPDPLRRIEPRQTSAAQTPTTAPRRAPSTTDAGNELSTFPSSHPSGPSPAPGPVSVSPLLDPASRDLTLSRPLDATATGQPATGAASDKSSQTRPAEVAGTPASTAPLPGRVNVTVEAPAPAAPSPAVASEPVDRRIAPAAAPLTAAADASGPATKPDGSYKNLWDRMRAGFTIPNLESPLVDRHTEWYASRPDYMRRVVERGRRYLHFVVEEVEKRGMPLEIALLPMIESAYNPTAYSKSHASGIWQFIPGTGRDFGLKQNWWYDGRRDVTAATRAALDYLEKLHGMFGDWRLALAAYNWGEGAVTRAIQRNERQGLPTDYESLRMPEETRNYIPKLQAVKNLVVEPERYGMALDEVPNEPYFIQVAAPGQIDFKRAAQLANVPLEEFRSLNPAYNRPVITPAGNGSLLIPADKAEIFSANLTKALDGSLVSWQTYRLTKHERLDVVAARFGTTAAQLQQVNGIKHHGRLRAGSTLLVPSGIGASDQIIETAAIEPASFALPEPDARPQSYRVRPGDTLRGIAERHHVTVRQLMDWNHLRIARVKAGQRVTVAAAARAAPSERIAATRSEKTHSKVARASDRKKARHTLVAESGGKQGVADVRGRKGQHKQQVAAKGSKKHKVVAEKPARGKQRVATSGRQHIARR